MAGCACSSRPLLCNFPRAAQVESPLTDAAERCFLKDLLFAGPAYRAATSRPAAALVADLDRAGAAAELPELGALKAGLAAAQPANLPALGAAALRSAVLDPAR